jgi:hypothetical protein
MIYTMSSEYYTIKKMIYELFQIGKKKDLEKDKLLHLYDNRFTKFSEGPPYHRLSIRETLHEEQQFFSKTSNYDFEIEDLQIDIFFNCNIAIATFILHESGEIVASSDNSNKDSNSNNSSILKRGNKNANNNNDDDPTSFYLGNFDNTSSNSSRKLFLKESVRASIVFLRLQDSSIRPNPHSNNNCKSTTYGWQVIHEHFSRIENNI